MSQTPLNRPSIARRRALAVAVLVAFVLFGASVELFARRRGGGGARDGVSTHASVHAGMQTIDRRLHVALRRRNAGQERAVDRVLLRTPFISAGGRHRREIALTFDDGPSPYTWRVMRALRRVHAPATFFQVGRMMTAFPRATRTVRRRYPVGDHTWSHPPLGRMKRPAQRREILEQAARMRMFGDRFPRLFRPPYASFDRDTLRVTKSHRMLMVLWSIDSADYTRPGTRTIVHNVVSRVRPGAIVLMHDGGGPRIQTVRAIPAIVRRLRRRGYRFVTVPQMLVDAPPAKRQKLPPGATGRG